MYKKKSIHIASWDSSIDSGARPHGSRPEPIMSSLGFIACARMLQRVPHWEI